MIVLLLCFSLDSVFEKGIAFLLFILAYLMSDEGTWSLQLEHSVFCSLVHETNKYATKANSYRKKIERETS